MFFFRMGLVVIDPDFGHFGNFHGIPPWVNGLTIPNAEDAVRSATRWGSPFSDHNWGDPIAIIFNRGSSRKMNRRLGSSTRHPLAKKLADHGPVAGTPEFGIDLVADEMEKGKELGITDSPGVGYVSFGEAVLECKDWVRGDLPEGSITEGSLEPPTSAASA